MAGDHTSDLFSLDGRVAFVTGAASGIGYAMAHGLAEHGALVVLNDIDAEELQRKVEELGSLGLKVEAKAFDVADFPADRQAVADIVATHGHLDVMVNNAGIGGLVPIEEWTVEEWQRHLDIHLSSHFVFCQEAGRQMIKQGSGSIINVSSIAADVASPVNPPYHAGKAGVVGLTKAMAAWLGPSGVRCNAIKPGFFLTNISSLREKGPLTEERIQSIGSRTMLGRPAQPREMAGLAVYLASDASSFMTGSILYNDGGTTSMLPSM